MLSSDCVYKPTSEMGRLEAPPRSLSSGPRGAAPCCASNSQTLLVGRCSRRPGCGVPSLRQVGSSPTPAGGPSTDLAWNVKCDRAHLCSGDSPAGAMHLTPGLANSQLASTTEFAAGALLGAVLWHWIMSQPACRLAGSQLTSRQASANLQQHPYAVVPHAAQLPRYYHTHCTLVGMRAPLKAPTPHIHTRSRPLPHWLPSPQHGRSPGPRH